MQVMCLMMASSMTTTRVGTMMNRSAFGIATIHIVTATMHWVMTAMSVSTISIRSHWSVHIRLVLYVFSGSAIWGTFLRDCAHAAIFIAAIHIMSWDVTAMSVSTVSITAIHIMTPVMHWMTAMRITAMRITALW